MADLIDRESLLADIEEAVVFSGRPRQNAEVRGTNKIIDRIKAASAVDAVPVVRCKDCKHYVPVASEFFDDVMCCTRHRSMNILKTEHDYCSWGERETDATDLQDAPTNQAEPVKHGRWEEWWPGISVIMTGEEMLYRCSCCDAKYATVENKRYCPNCGAKMDLEVDNDRT